MGQLAEYTRVYERNPTTLLEFGDFSGGEVLNRPEDSLQPNELSFAENVDIDPSGAALTVRDGLELVCPVSDAVTGLWGWEAKSLLLFVSDGKLYKADLENHEGVLVGSLSGTGKPVFAEWGEKGSEVLLIASGGRLQAYDGTTLSEVTPEGLSASTVFISNARVVIAKPGSSDTVWSAIGDHTNWTHDANDASSAQTLPVGYKDAGEILCLAPLSKDVVVFKSSGVVYRVTGSYPNWSVSEVARNCLVPSPFSALSLAGDVWFLDVRDGIRRLATTAAYGDVGLASEGSAVGSAVAASLTSDARIWHVKNRRQIWIQPGVSSRLYVYHYRVGGWTHYSYLNGLGIADAACLGEASYVAASGGIYRTGGTKDGENDYIATVRPRVTREPKPHVLVRFQVDYDLMNNGEGTALVGEVALPLPMANLNEDIAFLDSDEAYSDSDPLSPSVRQSVYTRQVWRSGEFRPEILVRSGRIRIRKIYLWVKGVSA